MNAKWKMAIVCSNLLVLSNCATVISIKERNHARERYVHGSYKKERQVHNLIYSGVRLDWMCLSRTSDPGVRGPVGAGVGAVLACILPLCLVDLPLSFVLDTALLPATGLWTMGIKLTGEKCDSDIMGANYCRIQNGWQNIFTDNGNGTVSDRETNLVWQKCTGGQHNDAACSGKADEFTWVNAQSYCKTLRLAGKSWRLPSIEEMNTLADKSRYLPDNSRVFPEVQDFYWSSTADASDETRAWVIQAWRGSAHSVLKDIYPRSVRCVASGPSEEPGK